MLMARLRTVKETLQLIKQKDSGTAITCNFIRQLCRKGIPLFHDWEKGASQLRRIVGLFAHKRKQRMSVNVESIIAAEAKRISAEYGKSFLDCDDIVTLTGLGRDNVRTLMKSRSFPVIQVGKRQVVSIVAFVTWQMSAYCEGVDGNGKR